jgi:hypothetical protein
LSSSDTAGPTDAIGVCSSALRDRSSQPRARATSIRRRIWPRLVSAIASIRPAAIAFYAFSL